MTASICPHAQFPTSTGLDVAGPDARAARGFELESSGIDRRPVPDYVRTWIALGNLGFLRRFPIGRFKLYRNVLEPVVSDDFSMTSNVRQRPVAALLGSEGSHLSAQ